MWLDAVYGAAGGSSTSSSQPGNGSTASAALLSNDWRFQGYQFTITTPNGTSTTTTFNIISDPTGDQYTYFTPTQTGTYTFTFNYPGQVYGAKDANYPQGDGYQLSSLEGDTYLPSNATTTLTVQQTPTSAATGSSPLPTAFWTRPIYGENSQWYTISSNWLGSSSGYSTTTEAVQASTPGPQIFHPDGVGSLTSHIMWTQEDGDFGGVVGGIFGTGAFGATSALEPNNNGVGYFEGSAYEQRFMNALIVDGVLYYKPTIDFMGGNNGPMTAVNLYTGQVLWTNPNLPTYSFAYIYNLWSGDEHGTFPPYFFTANFAQAYDSQGISVFNVTGVPSGTQVAGPNGEQLRYVMTNNGTTANPVWMLDEWNSSRLWMYDINPISGGGSGAVMMLNDTAGVGKLPASAVITVIPSSVTPTTNILVNGNIPLNVTTTGQDGTYANWISTYDWNISIPWHNNQYSGAAIVALQYDDVMLLKNGTLPGGFAATGTGSPQAPYTYTLVDINTTHSTFGQVLWSQTYQAPAGNLTISAGPIDFNAGVFTLSATELRNFYGYSLKDGSFLYETPSQGAFDYYGNPMWTELAAVTAYGNLYSSSFSGVLYCYNITTGALEWTYGNGGAGNSTNAGFNTSYGDYPTFVQAISNGVVYLISTEHTITDPIYKGAEARAVNATTGQEIWTLSAYSGTFGGNSYLLADGYNVWFNGYDDSIYCVGQGPSATTVQAPLSATTAGTNVAIQGTVLDVSAGTKQTEQAADFPYGVPVAADSIMGSWMGYVYQQQPIPTNFAGVTVTLTAIDPNGNYITLGTATTDAKGLFSYIWQAPAVPGKYVVTATFAGTNSYWPSSAQTTMIVQGPSATSAPTSAPISGLATASDLTYGIVAVIIVIIIAIGIVGLLLLRKKP